MGMAASIGLFLVAFGAATVSPFHSEPQLVSLLVSGKFSTPGFSSPPASAMCWDRSAIGAWAFVDRFRDRAWFPVMASSLEKTLWPLSLLLSSMPIFGNALTVLTGALREPWWSYLLLVTIAKKRGRYLGLAAATLATRSALGIWSNSHDARRRSCEIAHPVIAMSAMAMEEMH